MKHLGVYKFIDWLKESRKMAKMTTTELSKKIGKSQGYISHLEKGRINKIDFEVAKEICKQLQSKIELVSEKRIIPFVESDYTTEKYIQDFLRDNFGIISKEEMKKQEAREREARELLLNKIQNIKFVYDHDQADILDITIDLLKLDKSFLNPEKRKKLREKLKKIIQDNRR